MENCNVNIPRCPRCFDPASDSPHQPGCSGDNLVDRAWGMLSRADARFSFAHTKALAEELRAFRSSAVPEDCVVILRSAWAALGAAQVEERARAEAAERENSELRRLAGVPTEAEAERDMAANQVACGTFVPAPPSEPGDRNYLRNLYQRQRDEARDALSAAESRAAALAAECAEAREIVKDARAFFPMGERAREWSKRATDFLSRPSPSAERGRILLAHERLGLACIEYHDRGKSVDRRAGALDALRDALRAAESGSGEGPK